MAGRAHGHTEGLRKPHLMQWVLQQETPRKQVLLQIFSGTPEGECAHRMHMTLDEVRAIERWCADKGPTFVEDDYVMSYYATRSREEFCRVTGQSEGVYRLMELRYPKETRHAGHATSSSGTARAARTMRPTGTGVRVSHANSAARDDEAARKRREERRAAREQERERRHEEELSAKAEPEPRPTVAPNAKTAPTNPFDLPPRKMATVRHSEPPSPAAVKHGDTPKIPVNRLNSMRGESAPPKPLDIPKRDAATQPIAEQPKQQPKRAVLHTSEEHAKEIAQMASAACARCAERSVRPIPFSEFLNAFRRECNARGWTAEAVPGNAGLHRILDRDPRVMWTGADEFWFFDWKEHGRSITQAIEHEALMGREYSTRLFYRKERRLMRRLGVKAPDELYEILRRIYVDKDDEAVFGNHLSFGFGKIDRQKQIKRFVADHPGEPKSVLAMEYEREYGFSAGTAEIWIDLFARPDDVSISEWVERETVSGAKAEEPKPEHTVAIGPERPTSPAKEEASSSAAKPATTKQPDWIAEELTAASVPFVDNRAKYGSLWVLRGDAHAELIERLRAEGANFRYTAAGGRATKYQPSWWVAGYPERRELTAEHNKEAAPAEPEADGPEKVAEPASESIAEEAPQEVTHASAPKPEPEPVSIEAGSKSEPETQTVKEFLAEELTGDICDAGLVRMRFASEFPGKPDVTKDAPTLAAAGYYEDNGLLFRVGAKPLDHFKNLVAANPSFSKGEPGFEDAVWKHHSFKYLLRSMLADYTLLTYDQDSYISFERLHDVLGTDLSTIKSYSLEVYATVPEETPFTIKSLHGKLGFSHALDSLGMPDSFYEGLLATDDTLESCVLAKTRIFILGSEPHFAAKDFFRWLVEHHEGIERDDVPFLLRKDYGIDCPTQLLTTIASNADVFYYDVNETYYSSREVWKQEARNELNEPA